jgi:hypothetical protein
VLYLDFNGHTVTGTAWNRGTGARTTYLARPYDSDNDPTTFSAAEQEVIRNVWERVAEDFRPFDINVTTVEPTTFTPTTGRALITLAIDANGRYVPGGEGSGGVAYLDVFGEPNYVTNFSPAWVIADNVGVTNAANIAEVVSHEFGHNLALEHDGRVSPNEEYYNGHGSGPTSWGPIMGASYGRNVTTFSRGEYTRANNTEDDLAIIAERLPYRLDDMEDTNTNAGALPNGSTAGVIERSIDVDRYRFSTANGRISIAISPYVSASGTLGNNLDIQAEILNELGAVIATANPAGTGSVAFDLTAPIGVYYLRLRPAAEGNPLASPNPTGYTTYGSIGRYFIDNSTSTQPPPVITTQPTGIALPRGSTHTFTIVSDSTTTRYQWSLNGNPISGATSSSLTISPVTFARAGTYRCAVTNSVGTRLSDPAALAVYEDQAQTFTINPLADANLPTLVAGAFDEYRWFRDGELLTFVDGSRIRPSGPTLRINDALAEDSGLYTLAAKFNGQEIPIGPVTLVVRPPISLSVPPIITARRGDNIAVPITTDGVGVTFRYIDRPDGLGFDPATGTLTSGIPGAAPGTYSVTLLATDAVGNRGRADFQLVIQERTLALSLPASLTIYRGFDFQPPINTDGTSLTYAYSGLPSGLTSAASTGELLTTRALPASGIYPVTLTATDRYGTSASVSLNLTIGTVPAERIPPFIGLLARDPLNNQNLGAVFSLKPTAAGLVTGKITLGGVSYALSGRMRGAADTSLTANLTGTARGRAPLTLRFELPADGGAGSGVLIPAASASVPLQIWQAPYHSKNPATAFVGIGNLALFHDGNLSPSIPAGIGFTTWNVSTSGVATWAGRLADGTAVSGSSPIARHGEVPVYRPIPGVVGSLHGLFKVSPVSRAIDGQLTWSRGRVQSPSAYSRAVLYRDGFGPIALSAVGGPYQRPSTGTRVLGLTDGLPSLALEFIGAGLSDTALAQLAQPPMALTNRNTWIRPPAANNPAGLALSINASTGSFSGSFNLRDPNPLIPSRMLTRKVNFQGVLLDGRGVGYFLVPGLRESTATPPPTLSGAIIVAPSRPPE